MAWSALSSKHDFSKMRKKYDSFGRWKGARVTMAADRGPGDGAAWANPDGAGRTYG